MPISQFHIEQATAEYIREGLSPDDARRAALKAFGNPADVMEDVREVSMWIWWERLAQDLRYGLRGFRRTSGLRRYRRAVDRARDRRDHGDLQHFQHAGAAAAARS